MCFSSYFMGFKSFIVFLVVLLAVVLLVGFLISPNRGNVLKQNLINIKDFFTGIGTTGAAVALDSKPIEVSIRELQNNPQKYFGKKVKTSFIMGEESYLNGLYNIYDKYENKFAIKHEFLKQGEEYEAEGTIKKETRLYLYNKVEVYYIDPENVKIIRQEL